MTLRFRRALANDIPVLHALIERAYRGDAARQGWTHEADLLDGQRTDAAALAQSLRDPRRYMVIGEVDDAPMACAELTDLGDGMAYLGLVTVDPRRQGDGMGRAILAEAEQVAFNALGATMIEMTVIRQRVELIDWYQRRGYRPTGEERPFPYGDARFGLPRTDELDFVVLAKPLIAGEAGESKFKAPVTEVT